MNEPLTQLHAEAMTAEREWTVEEIPVLSASISLPEPVPAADKVSRRIRRYYQLQCRSFLRYCETYLLPAAAEEYRAALAASLPLPHFRAELTYQVTYNDGGLWSLYTQSRESGFSGRPTLLRHGDTWDLTSGYPVPLSAFFPRRSGWKRRLMEAAEAEIQRQETAGISRYHEGVRRLLRRHFNPQNFYLTAEGLFKHPGRGAYLRRASPPLAALATSPLRASSASRLGNTISALNRSERFQTRGASSTAPRATHTTAMQA